MNQLILRNKVAVLGGAAVGKSALIQSFHNESATFSPSYNMTLHSELTVKVVNIPGRPAPLTADTNVTCELYITDVSGNDLFSEYVPKYIKGATSYMLMFDITQPDSFAALPKWMSFLKHVKTLKGARGRALQLSQGILVATKLDQSHRRAVSQEEAEKFAKHNSLAYFETSSVDATNSEAPFYYLAHTFHERWVYQT
ncbi:Intraflagellar transport protein 27 [Kappamyces sp. JEL0680]|nr:Intraflagellar transport protein 27 [Kappamyces sp. JEL0680]